MDSEHSMDVFGVYQCFGSVGPQAVEEIVIARVLPYGELSGMECDAVGVGSQSCN